MSQELRKRLEGTIELLIAREKTREEYGQKDNPYFDECNYPTYCYIYNVAFYCAPMNPFQIEQWRKEGKTVDEMLAQINETEPTYAVAKFVPADSQSLAGLEF
jgi:hypothetical protein